MEPSTIPQNTWIIQAERQEIEGSVRRLYGSPGVPAELEDNRMLFRADFVEWDKDTDDVVARGHVYFHNFERNEQIWADHLEYNTEKATGKFYDVLGEFHPRVVSRPMQLTTDAPFHFQGQWAERIRERYVLHNGWITNCTVPKPWWRLRGPKFDIIPDHRAKAYRSMFLIRGLPLFFAPFFYHSLQREPRKSGFLLPEPGSSSIGGFMIGMGYYWAISRSYDASYLFQDMTSRGYIHRGEIRGAVAPGTYFDGIISGVQDRGFGHPVQQFSGMTVNVNGTSALPHGWLARGSVDYITSFRYQQEWTQSFTEAIGSELHSVGFINKDWSTFTFDTVVSRLVNYQQPEIQVKNPNGSIGFETDAVTIRKLPEEDFSSRDRQLLSGIPLWFSFDASEGLMQRAQPIFSGTTLIDQFDSGPFTNRFDFSPHLTSAFHLGSLHLVPSVGIDEAYYSESQLFVDGLDHQVNTGIVRSARDFSLDMIFPSFERVFNKKTVFGDKLKHVIEPRVTYRYVTGIGTDFERYIRFDETDLMTNTNQLRASLTNRIYAKRGDSVQEIFTFELAQERYFDPTFGGALIPGMRNVIASSADLTGYAFLVGPRTYSPVDALVRASPVTGLGIQWQSDYDPYFHGITNNTLSVDYRWAQYFVSAGNNQEHTDPALAPDANQFRFRVGYGDVNRKGWNAAYDIVYDYRAGITDFSTSQVTYNTSCCGISVQYRRYNFGLRDWSEWRVAFAVANIGTFGNLRKQDRLF